MKLNVDRIVAILAGIVGVLSFALDAPEALGLSPRFVAIVGGLVIGLSAVGRAIVTLARGRGPDVKPDWRDLVGAAAGLIAIGLGIEGVRVDGLDPNAFVGWSALVAGGFAWQRGGGPTPAASTGLVLLVLVGGCWKTASSEPTGTCAEFAGHGGAYGPTGDAWQVRYEACLKEIAAGRDVCIDRGAMTKECFVIVPATPAKVDP